MCFPAKWAKTFGVKMFWLVPCIRQVEYIILGHIYFFAFSAEIIVYEVKA